MAFIETVSLEVWGAAEDEVLINEIIKSFKAEYAGQAVFDNKNPPHLSREGIGGGFFSVTSFILCKVQRSPRWRCGSKAGDHRYCCPCNRRQGRGGEAPRGS